MNWQADVIASSNLLSALTCMSVAIAMLAFWLDKRSGLPHAWMLPLMSFWVLLCGLTRAVDGLYPGADNDGLRAFVDALRALLGIPIAFGVWGAVNELRQFAPPRQMAETCDEMARCIITLSESEHLGASRDAERNPSAAAKRAAAVGGVRRGGFEPLVGRGDAVAAGLGQVPRCPPG